MSAMEDSASLEESTSVAPGFPVFLGSEIDQAPADQAAFHVIPVPYEQSVSYGGGTGAGPAAILEASWQLETLDGPSTPTDAGIHTQPPVPVVGAAPEVLAGVARACRHALASGARPVGLGGEHTVTWGLIQGLLEAGYEDFGVVQVDAHADLRDAYEGNPYSHASVLRRVMEAGIPLVQLGVRMLCHEERDCRAAHVDRIHYWDAETLVPAGVTDIQLPAHFPAQVFFTLDVDGLDPAIFPATGTPVPGGLGWYQTLSLFESVARQRRILGFDLMEHAPMPGFHGYDFTAALLVYKLMGIVLRSEAGSLDA